MERYFGGKDGVSSEDRLMMVKLVEDFTSAYEDVLTIQAEGSLAAQRIMVFANAVGAMPSSNPSQSDNGLVIAL